jgi:DNA-binding transcriptional ArsR family regulator
VSNRTDRDDRAAGEGQRRDLLDALGDHTHGAIVVKLLEGDATQGELAEAAKVDISVVSRALKELRGLGLVRSRHGKGATHSIVARREVVRVLSAADRLSRSVNVARASGQAEAARVLNEELRRRPPGRGATG